MQDPSYEQQTAALQGLQAIPYLYGQGHAQVPTKLELAKKYAAEVRQRKGWEVKRVGS